MVRLIFLFLWTMLMVVTLAKPRVTSLIDLDSDEKDQQDVATTLTTSPSSKEVTSGPTTGTRKFSATKSTRQDSGLVRTRDTKKRRYIPAYDPSTCPTVINNIQIVINGNETKPSGVNECRNGVCNVWATSRQDIDGNVITDVRLSIVTNLEQKGEVGEVPVIEGIAGADDDAPPIFHPLDSPLRPHFLHNDIPQVRARQYFGNGESWYQGRRTFVRPPTIFYYPRNEGYWPRTLNPGQETWPPRRSFVDDKIEPPLSKTKSADE